MPRRAEYDRFAVDDLIRQQAGVVRTCELRACGVPAATITYRYRAGGPWQRLLPGIVLTHRGAATPNERRRAALLYCGPGAIITGFSALELYGARQLPASNFLHVLVPHERHRSSSGYVVVERTNRLPDSLRVQQFPVAPIARAAIDAARRLTDLSHARALLAELVQRRMCAPKDLVAELHDSQMRGTALARRVLREVSGGMRSVAEADAQQLIARHRIPGARWNCDIYDENGCWLGCPDAIWLELGVVLEIDSLEWHLSPADYQKTLARHRRMTAAGLLVVHVTPATIRDHGSEFIDELRRTLAAGSARPAPVIFLSEGRLPANLLAEGVLHSETAVRSR